MTPPIRIAVIIATVGRPDEVGDLLAQLQKQTHQPTKTVISVVSESDLPPPERRYGAHIVTGEKGLPRQRNRGLQEVLGDCDIIVFFDDDYIPSRSALEGIAQFFAQNETVVGMNGSLLADGIHTGGVTLPTAIELVATFDATPPPEAKIEADLEGLYGCNMAFRADAIGATRFDENLPLYGWQEDIDFAAQLLPRGRLVKTNAFAGVHRGVTRGRTSGVRLGYSQIANPLYMVKKGTMRLGFAARLMLKNFAANHVKSLKPEPWVDRLGRAKGNWIALFHLFTRRIHPSRILDL